MFRSVQSLRFALPAMGAAFACARSSAVHCEAQSAEDKDKAHALSPKEFRAFTVRKVTTLSHNTKALLVALPSKEHQMGLEAAGVVMVKGPTGADGKFPVKPYTPTSLNSEKGSFELVVKSYPNGAVSSHICDLKEGDVVEVKGPFQKFKYVPNSKRVIGMVAGGTGITPMLQVIKEIVSNPEDKTEVVLVFANRSEGDILLKDELDRIAAQHKNVKITCVLSQPQRPSQWTGPKGHVSTELLKALLPAPAADVSVYVCGPPGFMDTVSGNKTKDFKQGELSGALKQLGFDETMVFKF